MANLKPIGRILGAIGGLLMIIFGIIYVINNLLEELIDLSQIGFNVVGGAVGGDMQWVVSAAVLVLCGVIAVYGYQKLGSKDKGDLILWGIIYIVLGIVGGSIGGLITLIGGIILVIDYFI
ncbi:MAG: hypothetical protein ACXADY_04920 [Candidatus Hodarchaeales archaeon]|jgi:hypothetical protein